MERLIPLGDVRARDPEVAGHKAAELGRAIAADMPVLPGWVLPLGESATALTIGAAMGRRGSPAASVLAVSAVEIDDALRGELRIVLESFGGSVVVRSSSPLEADPRWSGAFATYLDVGADDVEAAIRGCWASAFTKDALARAERLEVDPARIGLAILIQPCIAFEGGGVAVVDLEDRIRVSATRGAPADLVSGRETGVTIQLDRLGRTPPASLPDGITRDMIAATGELARRVRDSLGDDTIEWGWSSGAITLLQARSAATTSVVTSPSPTSRRRRYPPVAARLASAASMCPGPLGERWVLPWAVALDELPAPALVEVHDREASIAEARQLSAELAVSVWQVPSDHLQAEIGASFRAILGPEPFDELVRLSTFRPPDIDRASRLLGLLSAIGRSLCAAGWLAGSEQLWWLSPDELERATRSRVTSTRKGHDRWEPFVFSVVEDRGRSLAGRSASPGIGAGRGFVLDGPSSMVPPPRRVLITSTVVPELASLLWGAAGLIARTGSEGAHLFEVARSLGVPAVVGVDLGTRDDHVIAVNGDHGTVSVLEAGRWGRRTREASSFPQERRTG